MVAHSAQRWEDLHEDTTPLAPGGSARLSGGAAALNNLANLHHLVADLIRNGKIVAAHDCSEGGIATAVAEMAIASGFETDFLMYDHRHPARPFHPLPSCYLVQPVGPEALAAINAEPNLVSQEVARMHAPQTEPMFTFNDASPDPCAMPDHPTSVALSELRATWQDPLDW